MLAARWVSVGTGASAPPFNSNVGSFRRHGCLSNPIQLQQPAPSARSQAAPMDRNRGPRPANCYPMCTEFEQTPKIGAVNRPSFLKLILHRSLKETIPWVDDVMCSQALGTLNTGLNKSRNVDACTIAGRNPCILQGLISALGWLLVLGTPLQRSGAAQLIIIKRHISRVPQRSE